MALINGTAGDDSIVGTVENDVIYAGEGNDTVLGGLGNDYIYGDEGNDSLLGGDGNDTIDGWKGNDSLFGGAGNDSLIGGPGVNAIDGGDGNDTADVYSAFINSNNAITFTFNATPGVLNTLPDGSTIVNVENLSLAGSNAADQLTGGTGNDTLGGSWGNDTVNGGDGDDLLYGGLNNSLLNGGNGNDRFQGHEANDTMIGGPGSDTADYSEDLILGGRRGIYADLNTGYVLDGYGGTDSLSGIENLLGTDGEYVTFTPTVVADNVLSDVLIGDGSANLIAGRGGLDYIVAGAGNDTVSGGPGNDIVLGGAGNDSLIGDVRPPGETFFNGNGNPGADFLFGEDGSDTLRGDDGDDWLIGAFWSGPSTGVDLAYGGAGNDVIAVGDSSLTTSRLMGYGEAGNDILYGGGGADTLSGGRGSDYLWGAGGADVFRFEAADLGAGDVDTVLMGFGEGDVLSFAASLSGRVSAIAGSSAGVDGVYLSVAVSGGYWLGWLPYQSVASVEAAIVYV
jgi:Ca2+-binding RTX toxin-like protein